MQSLTLKVSFIGHILIFLGALSNVAFSNVIPTPILLPFIYFIYLLDIKSCYDGIIPFYRCKHAKDIYIHHFGALFILTLSVPSLFVINTYLH